MKGNHVTIKGNVTKDAETRVTNSGNKIVTFGVAWNRSRKNQDGTYTDVTSFFDCKVWMTDKQYDAIEPLLVKGARVAIIEAHLEQERWEDAAGHNHSRVVIQIDDPISGLLVAPKSGNGMAAAPSAQAPSAPAPAAPSKAPAAPAPSAPKAPVQQTLDDPYFQDDDIPF